MVIFMAKTGKACIRASAVVGLALAFVGTEMPASAQSFQRLAPKVPAKDKTEPAKPEISQPRTPQGTPNPAAPKLKGIVIVNSREEIQPKGDVAVSGLRISAAPEFYTIRHKDFEKLIAPYFGKPIDEPTINQLQTDIIIYYRRSGHPLVDVVYPEQESVGGGVLQIFILEAKLGRIAVEGNKYFDTNTFIGEIRLRPAQPVDTRKLAEDIDWLNQNPARNVDAAFRPGAKLGESDLVLRVNDRFPLRGFVGYENSGPRLAGEDRLLAGMNWFDVFGQDHRFSYQYTTDVDFEFIHAHSVTYDIPLPWRHTFSLLGGYVDSKADFGNNAGPVALEGSSWQASARYQIPLPRIRSYSQDLSFGLDLKQFNNNFEFGGATLATKVDVVQFLASYRGAISDRYGRTSFGGEGYWSPGGITANNRNSAYAGLRNNSTADYLYSRFSLQRETQLPGGFSWLVRGAAQAASGNLQSSEQFGLGGYSTVRGYREREANGDHGIYLSNEFATPQWPLLSGLGAGFRDRVQLLSFFDYGRTYIDTPLPGEAQNVTLMSAGAGLRYAVRHNLSVRFDWGWQLKASGDPGGRNDQGHIAVVLSY
jgi:hemolysin activation/secretion protein